MRKILPFAVLTIITFVFLASFTAQAADFTDPGQTVNEPVPEEEEENEGGEKDEDSMVPIEPGDESPASQPGYDSFGLSLSSSEPPTHNSSGSPWGGILFFVAAICLGIGLAIARNKK